MKSAIPIALLVTMVALVAGQSTHVSSIESNPPTSAITNPSKTSMAAQTNSVVLNITSVGTKLVKNTVSLSPSTTSSAHKLATSADSIVSSEFSLSSQGPVDKGTSLFQSPPSISFTKSSFYDSKTPLLARSSLSMSIRSSLVNSTMAPILKTTTLTVVTLSSVYSSSFQTLSSTFFSTEMLISPSADKSSTEPISSKLNVRSMSPSVGLHVTSQTTMVPRQSFKISNTILTTRSETNNVLVSVNTTSTSVFMPTTTVTSSSDSSVSAILNGTRKSIIIVSSSSKPLSMVNTALIMKTTSMFVTSTSMVNPTIRSFDVAESMLSVTSTSMTNGTKRSFDVVSSTILKKDVNSTLTSFVNKVNHTVTSSMFNSNGIPVRNTTVLPLPRVNTTSVIAIINLTVTSSVFNSNGIPVRNTTVLPLPRVNGTITPTTVNTMVNGTITPTTVNTVVNGTISPTQVNTMVNGTITPTTVNTMVNGTVTPITVNSMVNGTISPTQVNTMVNGTMTPTTVNTMVNGTVTPITVNSMVNGTISPITVNSMVNGTITPTTVNTMVNGTMTPTAVNTMVNGTMTPTALNTMVNGTMTPTQVNTVVNGTVIPTTVNTMVNGTMTPTTVNTMVNGTMTPTAVNVTVNATPTMVFPINSTVTTVAIENTTMRSMTAVSTTVRSNSNVKASFLRTNSSSLTSHVRTSSLILPISMSAITLHSSKLMSKPSSAKPPSPSSSTIVPQTVDQIYRLTIEADCEVVQKSNAFKIAVKKSIGTTLGIDSSRIEVLSIVCGSVIADIKIKNVLKDNITKKLTEAVNSKQLTIMYNKKKLAVISVSTISLKPRDDDDDDTAFIIYIVLGTVMSVAFLIAVVALIIRCHRERSAGMFHLPNEEHLELSGFSRNNKSHLHQGNFYGDLEVESGDPEFRAGSSEPDIVPYGDDTMNGGTDVSSNVGYLPEWKSLTKLDLSEAGHAGDESTSGDNLHLTYGKKNTEKESEVVGSNDSVRSYDNPSVSSENGRENKT